MAAAIDAGLRKFHASLNVSDLDKSVAFYRVLLGAEPAKVRSDYAKFDIAEPPLVLSLIPGRPNAGGNLNHVGLRVRTAEELVEIQRRLEAAGMPTEREDGVECCYARQTKFWITDPDRALWEVYVFHEDVAEHGHGAPPPVAEAAIEPAAAPTVWQHRLNEPIPARLPYDDGTLHEAQLTGSINVEPATEHRASLVASIFRALRPGAALRVHGLTGDRTLGSRPSLPGPAAAVQHVPSAADVVRELVLAGFVDVQLEKLSQTAYFVVDGVSMREARFVARKPAQPSGAAAHRAVYLGPMAQVMDDFGNLFRRGAVTSIEARDWEMLSTGPMRAAFLFLGPDAAPQATSGGACCGGQSTAAADQSLVATGLQPRGSRA
jgi:catechol 2,3-dioxygenase-like lactoylglutathione lyase family enzyme